MRDAHQLAVRSLGAAMKIHADDGGSTRIDEGELDEELAELAATTSVDAVVVSTRDGQIVTRRLASAGPPPPVAGPAWELLGAGDSLHAVGRSPFGEGPTAVTIVVRQRGAAVAHEIDRVGLATLWVALPTLLAAAAVSWLLSARAMRPARAAYEGQRTFLADVSHELRTPVATLQAHVDVRLEATGEGDVARPGLEAMARQIAILVRLVDDLLLLARSEAAGDVDRFVELGADELAEGVVEDIAPRARLHGVEVVITRSDACVVRGDPAALQRMLSALVDNAVKHGGAGEVRVATTSEERSVVYTVEDEGPGIAPEDVPRVLARFGRGSTKAAGTGLGLPIADGIARAHGGQLVLESGPRGGLRVVVRLPGRAGG